MLIERRIRPVFVLGSVLGWGLNVDQNAGNCILVMTFMQLAAFWSAGEGAEVDSSKQ